MGFLDNIFKKRSIKSNLEQQIEAMINNKEKIKNAQLKSFNYQFIYTAIKQTFFLKDYEALYNDKEFLDKYLNGCSNVAVNICNFKDSRYENLNYFKTQGEDGSKAIVIAFEGPFEIECECNYIALFKNLNVTTKLSVLFLQDLLMYNFNNIKRS